jgi:hypothetical protein
MANFCDNCGKKLSFLHKSSNGLCSDCSRAQLASEKVNRAQLPSIKQSIKMSHDCTSMQQELLKICDLDTASKFYNDICHDFVTPDGFSPHDLNTLLCVQRATGLTDQQVHEARQSALTKALETRLASIEESIFLSQTLMEEQQEVLKTYDHKTLLDLYCRLYKRFASRKELDEHDIVFLGSVQRAFRLSDNEVHFEELVRPYLYANAIRNEHTLPIIDLQIAETGRPILRRGEVVHYGYRAGIYYDMKIVSNESLKGVQGVNFRVKKGVNYRLGTQTKNKLSVFSTNTSYGFLVITNKRIFLSPAGSQAPISITFNKILNFSCYNNGILIWIDGRQTPYFFLISNSGAIEIFGLCVIFLLDAESRPQYAQKERSPFRSIPTEVKNHVLERDGGCCVMCGSNEGIHFDHILPIAKGGDNTEDNIQILCKDCNLRKSDKIV